MSNFLKETWSEIEILKKSNWRNLLNNPISNNIIVFVLLTIVVFVSYKTYKLSNEYFEKNEISNGISSKFNTNDSKTISKQTEEFEIIAIYDTIEKKYKTLSLKDGNNILINNDRQIIKYKIEKSDKESFELGDIGDFIGGYFGFLIGVIGALLTFLAFYIQYKANKAVQKQFRLQQFEIQFHKMIDVHLNNKDKFSIVGYKNPKNKTVKISGVKLRDKLNFKTGGIINCLTIGKNIEFIDYTTRDHIVFQKFLVELKVVYRVFLEAYKENYSINEKELTENCRHSIFKEAYKIFFNGLNKYEKDKKKKGNLDIYAREGLSALKRIRNKHRKDGSKKFENFYKGTNGEDKTLWVKLNYEPFKGYLHFLPQYYRNLYSIVKYVVSENEDINLSEKQKNNYLRILRSTMSEYEQALLFYNWYSGMGSAWEVLDNSKTNNNFFKKYKMIHNLKKITLIDDEIDVYTILKIPDDKKVNFFESFE